MPRYIDADRIDANMVTVYDYKDQKWTHIFEIPEAIVRCGDCEHYSPGFRGEEGMCWHNNRINEIVPKDFYCGYGRRHEQQT